MFLTSIASYKKYLQPSISRITSIITLFMPQKWYNTLLHFVYLSSTMIATQNEHVARACASHLINEPLISELCFANIHVHVLFKLVQIIALENGLFLFFKTKFWTSTVFFKQSFMVFFINKQSMFRSISQLKYKFENELRDKLIDKNKTSFRCPFPIYLTKPSSDRYYIKHLNWNHQSFCKKS